MKQRVYLDHNATTPLRAAARAAMVQAMDVLGNPSSVHGEGRAALGLIQKARRQVAGAFGVGEHDIVWTSGATEAAAMALSGQSRRASDVEHDAVRAWTVNDVPVDAQGQVGPGADVCQWANSETGIIQNILNDFWFCDMTQAFGKLPVSFEWSGATMACASAHKLGGPKGVGCLILRRGTDISALFKGGGQELGRRAGTENTIGIAGFGAAAAAAAQDLADNRWAPVAKLRNILEKVLEDSGLPLIFVGQGGARLPNTSYVIAPGWKGETQVMQMDLLGFAISAGSACSSGKVKESRVLTAMGYTSAQAQCAIRISLGLDTTEDDIMRFATAWLAAYEKILVRSTTGG
ncbi:MAG: aminotransferase class V-fold PLP-dependent enzyme [Pseudomonadota bacterium]